MKRPAGFWIRFGAMIIDSILFLMVSQFIVLFVPVTNAIKEASATFDQVYLEYSTATVFTDEMISRFLDSLSDLIGANLYMIALVTVLGILYYIVIPYYLKGQTPGKWITGIKMLKNTKDFSVEDVTLKNLLLRYTIAPSYSYLQNGSIILFYILFNSSNTQDSLAFFALLVVFSILLGIVIIISAFLVAISYDKRGLHDYLGNTKTVYVNRKN